MTTPLWLVTDRTTRLEQSSGRISSAQYEPWTTLVISKDVSVLLVCGAPWLFNSAAYNYIYLPIYLSVWLTILLSSLLTHQKTSQAAFDKFEANIHSKLWGREQTQYLSKFNHEFTISLNIAEFDVNVGSIVQLFLARWSSNPRSKLSQCSHLKLLSFSLCNQKSTLMTIRDFNGTNDSWNRLSERSAFHCISVVSLVTGRHQACKKSTLTPTLKCWLTEAWPNMQ